MFRRRLKIFLVALGLVLSFGTALVTFWIIQLDSEIQERLKGRRFQAPVEFFSAPIKVFKGQRKTPESLKQILKRRGLVESHLSDGSQLTAGTFLLQDGAQCATVISTDEPLHSCLLFQFRTGDSAESAPKMAVGFDGPSQVAQVFSGDGMEPQEVIEIPPELFAQFVGNEPILRTETHISEVPPLCLHAILAIEDSNFLNHSGVSIGGILRAMVKNLFAGRVRQGGSTITQQLVKNYFLTPERTLRRKLKEFVMAILLESRATKDEILETYVNEIYMGQNGVFQVRGHGAASQHYFSKPLADLNLAECALLAAIINSPGKFNPFAHPEEATKRRTRVLDQMRELKLIDDSQHQEAMGTLLPSNPKRALSEPAPFFVDAVRARIEELQVSTDAGLRVYTTLDLSAQEAATQAVKAGVERLETQLPKLRKNKELGDRLEGALVSADPLTGFVTAIVGGRNYRESQFNRATKSQRQIGSLMKPIVYLSALESLDVNGDPRTPLTLLEDQKRTFTDHGQKWTPENYDGIYHDQVPMYFALKSSLNVATAQLGLQIGLDGIVDLARRLGVSSKLEAMPSLTLGAFEMNPLEVLQIYATLARFGNKFPLTTIDRIESLEGDVLYQFQIEPERVVAEDVAAVLVGMMKQTLLTGTARGISRSGFLNPAAGKTGTTSDYKDSWFAGFTPYHVAVSWVGYDSNKSHGLTGGSGAAPLWTDYMKNFGVEFPGVDFRWPEVTEVRLLDVDAQKALGVPDDPKNPLAPVELVFIKGTEP